MTTKRPDTKNSGAGLERQAIVAWVKRNTIKYPGKTPYVTAEKILGYLAGRTKRDDARKSGLGRK